MWRPRTLVATSLAAALLPLTLYSVLRNGAVGQCDLWTDLDPFEIDLQLFDRNDG